MNKAAGPKQPTPAQPEAQHAAGPGVSSLLKGKAEAPLESPPVPEPLATAQPSRENGFPVWYLFLADLLLVALALVLVFRDPGSVTWGRVAFASVATLFGAGLAIAGAFIQDQRREEN